MSGVPGYTGGNAIGSFTFPASQNLNAQVMCESVEFDRYGFGSASLTVTATPPKPVVNVSYAPNLISQGQSTTFSWSSLYADSCTGTGLNPVSGTSGSQSVAPAQGTYSTTVTCSGPGGTDSKTAALTVNGVLPPPPTVSLWADPDWLDAPGYTAMNWSSINATSCASPYYTTSGVRSQYVGRSRSFWISCTGPGGTGNAQTYVYVDSIDDFPYRAGTAKADAKAVAGLGLDLNKAGIQTSKTDLNADGVQDLIVVDTLRQEAHVLLAKNGKFSQIDRSIAGVKHLRDIKSIVIPAAGPAAVKVGIEN
ncbi:MAG: hypothetical protein HYV16_06365 [Gammaproteobacteria bacterium]|nr:hypothetical protein [Gammaproteobacteria bacterium]